jgi:hypothetical protein
VAHSSDKTGVQRFELRAVFYSVTGAKVPVISGIFDR